MVRQFSPNKFTPVDVIVVIFVCVLLMAVVQLAGSSSRDQANRMTCAKNLSVIARAMFLYANDYNDEFPRAGGRTTRWADKIADWKAPNRFLAYQLASDGNGGYATISSSLYLLIKYAGMQPDSFICPGDSGASVFNPAGDDAGDIRLIDLWDFGPYPSGHYSYAYHLPYCLYALTTSSDPGMAVAADRNPWMNLTETTIKDLSFFNPDGGRKAIKAGNSYTHENEGQNVLFVDGHVSFETESFCGVDNDNIYTFWDGGDIRLGSLPTALISQPQDNRDSLLVNDSQIYKGTKTNQPTDVNSSDLQQTSIIATLDCPMSEHRNVIWCSTFQMVWDKMKDDIIGEPIQVIGAEELASRLNQAKISTKDLNEESYYVTAGFINKGITEEIQKQMAKRFPDESVPEFNEFEKLPDFMRKRSFLAYCFLNVYIGFKHPFYTNNRRFEFVDSYTTRNYVESFCSNPEKKDSNADRVREQIDVLYYKSSDQSSDAEFAVDLSKNSQPYQVILALVPKQNTLSKAIAYVQQKISGFKRQRGYRTMRNLRPIDRLIVPDVFYKLTHHYAELEDKRIGNQPWQQQEYVIFKTMQVIDFSLSRTGVILKSESRMSGGPLGGLRPRQVEVPRYFYFNRPFLIYVKKRGDEHNPFFVMWVDNAELLNEFK